jgi:hypothetical protein
MALEVLGVEIDWPEIAARKRSAWSMKCGESGSPLLPPSLIAKARSFGPNSTTETKVLPLVA